MCPPGTQSAKRFAVAPPDPSPLVIGLLAAKVALLVVMSVNTRFVADEFWQFGQSKFLWAGFYDTIWPVKAQGYALWYWPAHWLGRDATSTLMAGRLLAVLTVAATLGVLFAISRALGFSRVAAVVSLLLLLSVSTYMERSFRLRSETPAILFAALSVWVLVAADGLPRIGRAMAAGVLTGCAFLCTQKAVYFNVALGLGLVTAVWLHAGVLPALRQGVGLVAGWGLALLGYALLFGGADALGVLWHLAVGPADLALKGGAYYEGMERYIVQTLSRNGLAYAVFVAGLVLVLTGLRHRAPAVVLAAVFTATLTGFVFAHNQPWPYVFAMALPFLALWAPVVWTRCVDRGADTAAGPTTHRGHPPPAVRAHPAGSASLSTGLVRRHRRTLALLVVGTIVGAGFVRSVAYLEHDNRHQIDRIRTAETILGPTGTYFDGIGMLPTHVQTPRRWLDVRAIARIRAGQDDLVEALAATPPDLIIETSRTDRLPEAFASWVAARYVAVAPGLLVPGTILRPESAATLTVVAPGWFTLEDPTHRLMVDGSPVRLPVKLAPGTHTLRIVGANAPTRLLPRGVTVPARQTQRAPLFSGAYTR